MNQMRVSLQSRPKLRLPRALRCGLVCISLGVLAQFLAACGTMHAPAELVLGQPRKFSTIQFEEPVFSGVSSTSGDGSTDKYAIVGSDRPELLGILMNELSGVVAGSAQQTKVAHPIEYSVLINSGSVGALTADSDVSKRHLGMRGTCVVVPGILGKHSASHIVEALCRDDWAVIVVWPPLIDRMKQSLSETIECSARERGTVLGRVIDDAIRSTATVATVQLIRLQTVLPELRGKPVLLLCESMGAIAGVGVAASGKVPYDAALFVAGGGGFLDVARQTSLRGLLFGGVPLDDQEFTSAFEEACTSDPLRSAGMLRGGPVAVITAANDAIVPSATQEALWKALGEPPRFEWSGGHLELFWFGKHTVVPVVKQIANAVGSRSRAVDVLFKFSKKRSHEADEPSVTTGSAPDEATLNGD